MLESRRPDVERARGEKVTASKLLANKIPFQLQDKLTGAAALSLRVTYSGVKAMINEVFPIISGTCIKALVIIVLNPMATPKHNPPKQNLFLCPVILFVHVLLLLLQQSNLSTEIFTFLLNT